MKKFTSKCTEVNNVFIYCLHSPYSGRVFSLERTVGGITYEDGNISGARAFKVSYALKSNLQLDKSSGEEVTLCTITCYVMITWYIHIVYFLKSSA